MLITYTQSMNSCPLIRVFLERPFSGLGLQRPFFSFTRSLNAFNMPTACGTSLFAIVVTKDKVLVKI